MEITDKKKMASIIGCATLSISDFVWVVLAVLSVFNFKSIVECSVLIDEMLVTPLVVESIWMHLHKLQKSYTFSDPQQSPPS